jgi:hypothetical protein
MELSASRPGRFYPGKRAPASYFIGRWVGLRTLNNYYLRYTEEEKIKSKLNEIQKRSEQNFR